jgi:hypothetical protein
VKKIGLLTIILLLLACAKSNAQQEVKSEGSDTTKVMQVEPAYQDTVIKDFHFMWRVDTVAGLLHVKLMAPTTGWVAVGFAPTNIMKDANLILGYMKSDTAYISDEFGVALTSHSPDTKLGGSDDISELSGMESEDLTEIHFAIPLNSGDRYDKVLEPGKRYKLIFAMGGADNFTTKHTRVASMMLTL